MTTAKRSIWKTALSKAPSCVAKKVKKLPDNLTVGESLKLSNMTPITSLSDNLVVSGDLWFDGKPHMAPLPDNLMLDESLLKEEEI